MKKIFILMLILTATSNGWARPIAFCYSYETNGMLAWENYDSNSTYHVIWTLNNPDEYVMSWQTVGQLPMPNTQTGTVAVPLRIGVVKPPFTKPAGMEYIEEGPFVQGGTEFYDSDEIPTHTHTLDSFYMDKFEVSKALWDRVLNWGLTNGYTDLIAGVGGWNANTDSPRWLFDHPVVMINWYDVVKWCNARSEAEGLEPAYYYNDGASHIYRTDIHTEDLYYDSSKTGYRLPTESEWEKAARGGLEQHIYPWPSRYGDDLSILITNVMANYLNSDDIYEAGTTPVGYYNGSQYVFYSFFVRYSAHDMANGYGLYDMAGNVSEWCWDWYDESYYTNNYIYGGPSTGTHRVVRGGSYSSSILSLRCSQRSFFLPTELSNRIGFRCVRRFSLD